MTEARHSEITRFCDICSVAETANVRACAIKLAEVLSIMWVVDESDKELLLEIFEQFYDGVDDGEFQSVVKQYGEDLLARLEELDSASGEQLESIRITGALFSGFHDDSLKSVVQEGVHFCDDVVAGVSFRQLSRLKLGDAAHVTTTKAQMRILMQEARDTEDYKSFVSFVGLLTNALQGNASNSMRSLPPPKVFVASADLRPS